MTTILIITHHISMTELFSGAGPIIMNAPDRYGSRKLKVFATATLIRRFHEKNHRSEIYENAVRCYDMLVDCLQKPLAAKELADLLHLPETTVMAHADSIINLLLFNKLHDPYLSFGLKPDAQMPEVTRRWKSLIILYHPDKYLNSKMNEERVRKINETYEQISVILKQKKHSGSFTGIREMRLPEENIPNYSRYLPSVMITLAIIAAIFSVLLFIVHLLINDIQIL
jgi:DnaJ-domain-containing protein 1